MKKTICILCAMLTAGMMMVSPCLAVDEIGSSVLNTDGTVTPYYLAISSAVSNISRSGNYVRGYAMAYYDITYTATISVNVQRSRDEINWTKAGSFGTASGVDGEVYCEGDLPAISGYSYRLASTVTVYDGSRVVETLTFYSNII